MLRESNMPATLVEFAFISNAQDRVLLTNKKDKTIFKEATKLIYWGFFTEMVDRQGADNLNIKEVMHDANKLTLFLQTN